MMKWNYLLLAQFLVSPIIKPEISYFQRSKRTLKRLLIRYHNAPIWKKMSCTYQDAKEWISIEENQDKLGRIIGTSLLVYGGGYWFCHKWFANTSMNKVRIKGNEYSGFSRKYNGVVIEQVQVAPQQDGSMCGYHSINNAEAILWALNGQDSKLRKTDSEFPNEWDSIVEKNRKKAHETTNNDIKLTTYYIPDQADWLHGGDIDEIAKEAFKPYCKQLKLPPSFDGMKDPYLPFTSFDDVDQIDAEYLPNNVEKIDEYGGLFDTLKYVLNNNSNYTHTLFIGSMEQEDDHSTREHGHWITMVVHQENDNRKYIIADSTNTCLLNDSRIKRIIDKIES